MQDTPIPEPGHIIKWKTKLILIIPFCILFLGISVTIGVVTYKYSSTEFGGATIADDAVDGVKKARPISNSPTTTTPAAITDSMTVPGRECSPDRVGLFYTGHQSVSASGKKCQRWDKQTPHQHQFRDPAKFPDASLDDAANFCRNPDNDPGVWCYVTEGNNRKEQCDVPLCVNIVPGHECSSLSLYYTGLQSVSAFGHTCQRWDKQTPHQHQFGDSAKFPDASLDDASNFCRNPDNDEPGLWCYVTEGKNRFELCDVPLCVNIGCYAQDGGYVGNVFKTTGHKNCVRWDAVIIASAMDGLDFLNETLQGAANWCRNPINQKLMGKNLTQPWCYTRIDGRQRQFCDVPKC